MAERGVARVPIDVGGVLRTTVASLYSHLVTRPTGRAVRGAIERTLAESGATALSVVDLSEVTVLDFSCADEVVAKLLLRFLGEDRPGEAFFVFRGVGEVHRHPIEEVLERHALRAVVEGPDGAFELLGPAGEAERFAWEVLERRGRIEASEAARVLPDPAHREALAELARARVVYRGGREGPFLALSRLIEET
ncbi:MAG: hypothetical protein D6701_11410, partial [Gemmatimonadetes bacterium]